LDRDPAPALYVPIAQVPDTLNALNNRNRPLTWAVRTTVNPLSLRQTVERELQVANPNAWIARVRTMDQIVAESTARARFNVMLLSLFALIAVVLAGVGLYGLMSYSVEQRRREIGIRMAIGALPADVGNMILAEAFRLVAAGLGIGVMAALSLTRMLESLVYGVKAWDPLVAACVALLLGGVALLAAWIPARRAARVNPIQALQHG
jgi:ABC-type antimicrobial peptide transport system permease subunit